MIVILQKAHLIYFDLFPIMTKQLSIILILLFNFLPVFGQNSDLNFRKKLPLRAGLVNDFENIFTDEQEKTLDSVINQYEIKTTIEISVITIPSKAIDKESFDDLVFKIANSWGVGKGDKNNGILIGISKDYRKIRISNGLGIEKLMTDNQTKEIINNTFIPSFKKGDFYQGTLNGVQDIIMVLDIASMTSEFIDLNKISVWEFINLLKIDTTNKSDLNILTIGMNTPENWINAKDIDTLMTIINSNEPSKCIVQVISSYYLPIGESSTIGGQVMDIIEAYKDNKAYPNKLTSCSKTDEQRIKAIELWWKGKKKQ
jgi:uncharacterized protein